MQGGYNFNNKNKSSGFNSNFAPSYGNQKPAAYNPTPYSYQNQANPSPFGAKPTPPQASVAPSFGNSNSYSKPSSSYNNANNYNSPAPSKSYMTPYAVEAGKGYVSPPEDIKKNSGSYPPLAQKRKRVKYVMFGTVLLVVVAVAAIALIASKDQLFGSSASSGGNSDSNAGGGSPTPAPTSPPVDVSSIQLFPVETRTGNNYVGIYFLTEMDDGAFEAFLSAAARWSAIVAGTTFPGFSSSTLCLDSTKSLGTTINFDHLAIGASVVAIDGVNGILGQAGPCVVRNGANLPLQGNMEFDSADVAQMLATNTFQSVVLHEMGHVLGIGTMWTAFGFLQDSTAQNGVSVTNQPKFTGPKGTAAFDQLSGTSTAFVPVENGFTNGKSNGAGSGSLDSHWDEDFLPGELMVFAINLNGPTPPLSLVTIQSIADFGYTVDTSQADPADFTGLGTAGLVDGEEAEPNYLYLHNDMFTNPVVLDD